MKEALLYETQPDGRVRCHLCAHRCLIGLDRAGLCLVRKNHDGKLKTFVYERTISQHVDPVEKKPLFHFFPGSRIYSIAAPGCNFQCRWCQNWNISQMRSDSSPTLPKKTGTEEILLAALGAGCRGIAYTYTEPTIFFEFALDTARMANEAGLANIYVTNGYMTEELLDIVHPYLDAANVDLKAFRDKTYRRYVGARLQPVLDSMKEMKRLGIWLEVTTLVIPGINDDPEELTDTARFIARELGVDTPWHLSRFFPAYAMQVSRPTPVDTHYNAYEIGQAEGLNYVYVGNLVGKIGKDTLCPGCGRLLIRRSHYLGTITKRVRNGLCPDCWTPISGLM